MIIRAYDHNNNFKSVELYQVYQIDVDIRSGDEVVTILYGVDGIYVLDAGDATLFRIPMGSYSVCDEVIEDWVDVGEGVIPDGALMSIYRLAFRDDDWDDNDEFDEDDNDYDDEDEYGEDGV